MLREQYRKFLMSIINYRSITRICYYITFLTLFFTPPFVSIIRTLKE